MTQWVYLNGEIVDADRAHISVDDRGFTFADGIYEVVRVYGGRTFELARHMRRLRRSARELRLELDPDADEIERVCHEMVRRQGLDEAIVYVQVTRGAAPRAHPFPAGTRPTTLVRVRPIAAPPAELLALGASAITVPDDRWARCDIKSIGLTANVLAKQRAVEAGAFEAIFVRDGFVTDCASCNVFAVLDGTLATAPATNYILAGITREVTLELARGAGVAVREEPFRLEQLRGADEVFLTATTLGVMPVTRVDGAPIAGGRPGPLTKRLYDLFHQRSRGTGAALPAG